MSEKPSLPLLGAEHHPVAQTELRLLSIASNYFSNVLIMLRCEGIRPGEAPLPLAVEMMCAAAKFTLAIAVSMDEELAALKRNVEAHVKGKQ